MTGLEFLQEIVNGRVSHPSMADTLGFCLTEVTQGRAVITGRPSPDYCNPNGSIHGGWPAALLDSCMGSAVHSTLAEGRTFTVVEFKIDFVRPVTVQGGEVRAIGRTVNVGRRIGLADGELLDSQGRLLARGTTTCLISG